MHVTLEETLSSEKVVNAKPREISAGAYREVDRHFAQVESWHEELAELDVRSARHVHAITDACVTTYRVESSHCSLSETSRHATHVVSNHQDSETRGLKPPLEREPEQRGQRFQGWASEKDKRLALQHDMKAREEALILVQQTLEQDGHELGIHHQTSRRSNRSAALASTSSVLLRAVKRFQAALEKKEETLDARREQWDQHMAERERTLASRERRLDRRQRKLDRLRHQLDQKAAALEEESRCPRIMDSRLREPTVTRDTECVQKQRHNEQPARGQTPLEIETPGEASPHACLLQLENPTDLKEDLEHPPPREYNSSPDAACLEKSSPAHVRNNTDAFETLVDRLVTFHLAKTKKWYQFWR